jgi:hypothetical protein
MEQDLKDRAQEPAGAWVEDEADRVRAVAVDLEPARVASVYARHVGKDSPTRWAYPAISSAAPNAGTP